MSQPEIEIMKKNKVQKILVVDDQSFNIQALKVILKYSVGLKDNHLIDSAKNGQEALDKVMENVE